MLENLTDEECALYAITQDPSGIDLAEFCVYAPIDEETDGCFRARPYQVAWWRCTDTLQIDQCSRSVGKALHTVTKVPTPEGWTTMGDLVVGDVVFNEQGEPVDVLEVFDVMDNRPCFKVKFSDGSEIIADADHEWVVNSKNRRDKSKKTVTTQDLLGTSIDVAKPLVLDDKDYGILSPYLLGYWLGDGHSAGAMLTIGDEDYEDVEQILDSEGYFLDKLKGNILYAVRLNGIHDIWTELPVLDDPSFRPRKDSLTSGDVRDIRIRAKNGEGLRELASEFGIYPSSVTQFIRGEGRISAGGPIRGDLVGFELNRILKKLNLHNNKHVPDSYMRGSESQRLALLQGLMDSDGHCRADGGRCEVTFKSELLARSVFELAASLGQKPHIASKRARCNGVDAGIVWRVGFKPLDIQPFRIKRKADRVQTVTPLSRTKLTHRIVESVDPIVSVPVRCIRVSGPSSLFLVGDTMIPTHNSKSIQLRALAFPFLHPKQEMVVTAPELNHLQPITGIIEEVFDSTRLAKEMLQKSRSRISHRPFIMNFSNGSRILGKIPQRDGKGMKGTHPLILEQDEAQDYPHAGWTEIIETLRQGMKGATWRAHGVTRGVQDDFYKRSADPKTEWTVHRIYAMHSPEWSDDIRRKKIAEYGSRDDPDYRRNILGEHGDSTNPLFVLHRLMRVIDTEVESEYNADEYNKCRITSEILADAGGDVDALLARNIPAPDSRIKTFWGGCDVGFTNDPTEILIFGEYQVEAAERKLRTSLGKKSPAEGESCLKLLARVQLVRVKASDQVRVISWLFKHFQGMKAFGMDATGNGLPLFQDMQDAAVGYVEKIKGYKFGSKIVVGFDENVEFDEMIDDPADEAAIHSIVEIYATDVLRTLVDQGRLWLPFDDSLLASFQGQMQVVKSDMDMYGKKRRYSSGNFHVLDAARMAILAWKQNPIEKLLGHQVQQDVIDVPMYDDFLEGW